LIQASIEAFSMLAYVCGGRATQKQAPHVLRERYFDF
jgi:hypothetical protein